MVSIWISLIYIRPYEGLHVLLIFHSRSHLLGSFYIYTLHWLPSYILPKWNQHVKYASVAQFRNFHPLYRHRIFYLCLSQSCKVVFVIDSHPEVKVYYRQTQKVSCDRSWFWAFHYLINIIYTLPNGTKQVPVMYSHGQPITNMKKNAQNTCSTVTRACLRQACFLTLQN